MGEMSDYYAALKHVAKAMCDLRETITPDQSFFAKIQFTENLDRAGAADEAASVRTEILRTVPTAIEETLETITRESRYQPHYQIDEHRLICHQLVLCFVSAAKGLTKHLRDGGCDEDVKTICRAALSFFARISDTAKDIDGLRRTFGNIMFASAFFHFELARILKAEGEIGGAIFHSEEAIRAGRGNFPIGWDFLGDIVADLGGDIDAIREAADRFAGVPIEPMEFPVTRWGLVRNAMNWLNAVEACRDGSSAEEGRRIAIAAFNMHHVQFCFALSCVLLAMGHRVDFVWLPSMRHERPHNPEPYYGYWDEQVMAGELDRLQRVHSLETLELFDLCGFPLVEETEEMRAECRYQAQIDTINMLARVEVSDEESSNAFRSSRYALNLDALRRLQSFFEARPCDLAIVFNGGVMEYGPIFYEARRRNVRVITFESSAQRRGNYVMSVNRTFADRDTAELWRVDDPHVMSAERRERVLDWLDAHGAGDHGSNGPRGKRVISLPEDRELLESMGLNPDKPTVTMFPNLTWDTGVIGRDSIFDSVRDWVLSTVEYFEHRPQHQLIIRIHPLEKSRSSEYVGQFVRDRWPTLPTNVHIVESEEPLSSYRLLDVTQLVLVYTGNLGIESSMFGMHVVCAGRPHYGGRGFTREPGSRDAYFKLIERILNDPEETKITEREIELAWCYGDIYWNQIPQPYPWKYDDFLSSVKKDWPMDRVLSPEGMAKFGRTFRLFAGDHDLANGMIGSAPDRT